MCDCNDLVLVETVGEFKKGVKALVKGAIKSKLFGGDNAAFTFKYTLESYSKKEKIGTVAVCICNEQGTGMLYRVNVSTRVYNKVNAELFAPMVTQFEKLKSVNNIAFEESPVCDGENA